MNKIIRLPKEWKDWRIVERAGEGSFGKVFKAERLIDGHREYSAIKIITVEKELKAKASLFKSREFYLSYYQGILDEYMQEVRIMEALRGEANIVQIQDYLVEEAENAMGFTIYIRMEFLQTMNYYISKHTVDEEMILRLGTDLCTALSGCHRHGLIHRDIKAGNVFVTQDGHFKLGDFGEAIYLSDVESAELDIRGSFSNMAPEVYNGEDYNELADQYSLGMLMYITANNGCIPFCGRKGHGINRKEFFRALECRMRGAKLPEIPGISSRLNMIIGKACSFNPEDRFRTPEEFKRHLDNRKYLQTILCFVLK